jgi:hypothetical protein
MLETSGVSDDVAVIARNKPLAVVEATSDELAAHQQYLENLAKGGACLWDKITDSKTE